MTDTIGSNTVETVEEIGAATFPEGQSNVDNMLDTLQYMAKGMLGILIVTAIIIGCVVLLNKLTSPSKKKKSDE